MDDFRVCEANGLSVEHFLDANGRFLSGDLANTTALDLAGMSLTEAGSAVLTRLEAKGLVLSRTTVQHEYPHCWRHKKPLFFKASEEWFLDLTEVGPRALKALDEVAFTPAAGKERLSSMLRSRTSWCLSRNRLWGTPLATPETSVLLDKVAVEGVDAWHAQGPQRTLDVWFDSGVTHALVMQERFGRTADLYLEGSDQHRGWFQSSLLTSVAATGAAPFKELLTHGFVVDEHGKKYAKSSGNYVPLAKLFERYSPDVLRLWTLSQDYTHDLKMSAVSLDRTMERYRKFRNTLRFCLQNTTDFDFSQVVPLTQAVHQHQMNEMARVLAETLQASERYDFAAAVTALVQFCEVTSADYFTALKDTLYCDAPQAPKRLEAQYMLGRLLDFLLRVLMPVLPYTVEELFQAQRVRMGYAQDCSLLLTLAGMELPVVATSVPAWRELKTQMNSYVEANRSDALKSPAQLDLVVTSPVLLDAEELAGYFGCATVRVESGAEVTLKLTRTSATLCPRCRRHHPTVLDHLCTRCQEVEETQEHLGPLLLVAA